MPSNLGWVRAQSGALGPAGEELLYPQHTSPGWDRPVPWAGPASPGLLGQRHHCSKPAPHGLPPVGATVTAVARPVAVGREGLLRRRWRAWPRSPARRIAHIAYTRGPRRSPTFDVGRRRRGRRSGRWPVGPGAGKSPAGSSASTHQPSCRMGRPPHLARQPFAGGRLLRTSAAPWCRPQPACRPRLRTAAGAAERISQAPTGAALSISPAQPASTPAQRRHRRRACQSAVSRPLVHPARQGWVACPLGKRVRSV